MKRYKITSYCPNCKQGEIEERLGDYEYHPIKCAICEEYLTTTIEILLDR